MFMGNAPASWDLGQIYHNGTSFAAAMTGFLGNDYLFPNLDRSTARPWSNRYGQYAKYRLVKNTGSALTTPRKNLVAINPNDPGAATALASSVILEAYPVDEWLPSTQDIAANDLFWVCTGGICSVITAATVTADITAGDYLNPSAVTAGAVDIVNTFTANKALFGAIKNACFKACANRAASGGGGLTILVEVIGR
jgi:hypothetical protein